MVTRCLLLVLLLLTAPLSAAAVEEAEAFKWANAITLESISNFQGGIEQGSRQLANLDLALTIDTVSANWWGNGTFFFYVLGNYGQSPSDLTGDLQTLSNIQAPHNLKFEEFWYQHSFADGAVKLLLGMHDYNSTFYTLESAGLFSAASFGIGPDTSQVGPSIFPNTAATVHLTLSHNDQYFICAVYDGIPGDPDHPHGTHFVFKKSDGLFKAVEWGFAHEKSYKFAIGGWQHTAELENPVDGSAMNSNTGFYIIGEKNFSDDLAAFFQYGHADAGKNQLDSYAGTGVTLANTWVDEDAIGLGYAYAHNGRPFLRQNPDLLTGETVWELSYHRPLVAKMNAQTSLYYIDHPSMEPALGNVLALGVRFYFEF